MRQIYYLLFDVMEIIHYSHVATPKYQLFSEKVPKKAGRVGLGRRLVSFTSMLVNTLENSK